MALGRVVGMIAHHELDLKPVVSLLEALKPTDESLGTIGLGAAAQPFVEGAAIHHSNKAIFNGNVHLLVAWRDHARATNLRHKHLLRNLKVPNGPRGNGAPAGLDAACLVNKQNAAARKGKIVCSRGASGASTNDNHFVVKHRLHGATPNSQAH